MENIQGYEIEKSVLFENSRGFALGHNPAAPQPYVTWQFTENEGGVRDYYWGHYHTDYFRFFNHSIHNISTSSR